MDYVEFSTNYAKKSILLLRPIDWMLAVVLATIVACIAIYLKRQNRISIYQAIAAVLLVTYVFLVFSSTVFSRSYTGVHSYRLLPFWSYREIFHYGRMDLLVENLLNIVLLMPAGFLLPVLNRKFKLKHIILAASVMSYTIELSQLIFCKGLFELFDDPFHNILGAVIGYGMYMGVKNWKYFEK